MSESEVFSHPKARLEISIAIAIIAIIAVCAAALFAATVIQPATIRHWLDTHSNKMNAGLSDGQIQAIQDKTRLLAESLAAIATVLIFTFRPALLYFLRFNSMFGDDAIALKSETKHYFGSIAFVWWFLLAVTVAGGLGLRLMYLGQPMRTDEAQTYLFFASKPLLIGLSNYAAPNNHLFHTLLCHVSIAIFGDSPKAIRLPAFVAGVTMIPLTFLVGARWFSPAVGSMASALVATCSYVIEYSTNARGYTVQATLVLVSVYLIGECIRRPNWAAATLAAVAASLSFWTIPTTLYPYTAAMAWWWVAGCMGGTRSPEQRRLCWLQWFVTGAATVLLTCLFYSPVLLTRGPAAIAANAFVLPLSIRDLCGGLPAMCLTAIRLWTRNMPCRAVASTVVFLAVVGAGRRQVHPKTIGVFPLLIVITLILVVAQRVLPFQRVWVFLIPFCSIAVGTGVWVLGGFLPGSLPIGVVAVYLLTLAMGWSEVTHAFVTHSEETGMLPNASQIADFLATQVRPGDRVVSAGTLDLPLSYYLKIKGSPSWKYDPAIPWEPNETVYIVDRPPVATIEDALQRVREFGPANSSLSPSKIAQIGDSSIYRLTYPEDPGPIGVQRKR